MLVKFSIENFLSFKDRQVFSMIAGKSGRDKSFHLVKKTNRNDINLLKMASVFGPNASGKSNLVKAIHFGKKLVLSGTKTEKPINFQQFRLDSKTLNKPTRIEYEIKHKGTFYAYGFVLDNKKIIEEWLYEIGKYKEKIIFSRSNTTDFDLGAIMKENKIEKEKQFIEFIAKGTPDNQLFITEIRNRKVKDNVSNIEALLNVIDWFQNALTIIYPDSKIDGIEFELEKNKELSQIFDEILNYFDTGINGISLQEVELDKIEIPKKVKDEIISNLLNDKSEKTNAWVENPIHNVRYIFTRKSSSEVIVRKLMTKHLVKGKKPSFDYFDLNEESDGTQRIMDFIPMLIDLFKGNNVFVVDEMERSLHPNLIYDIVDLFLEKTEGINSQLIIASHESSLLTQKLLRKDEIWFAVKNKDGASSLYSLEDFDIRFDKQIRKDYLLGRYKAIPRFGSRNKLSILTN